MNCRRFHLVRKPTDQVRPAWRPIPALVWMLGALVAVAVTSLTVIVWLWTVAGQAKPGTDQASARLDAVRTGLAAGAGAGAAVGLMLAFRRQHHQEIATVLTDLDATERRITELYTRATEQLGNDRAPVRLGGLYALERLAQDNAAHRQTIANVISAYLRMPFPAKAPERPDSANKERAYPAPAETDTAIEARVASSPRVWEADAWAQEKQVRLTAQHILTAHLRKNQQADQPSSVFWSGIRIDPAGATLFEFDLTGADILEADFSSATFFGSTFLDEVSFAGEAVFTDATFDGIAFCRGTRFTDYTSFGRVSFMRAAAFEGASFSKVVWFDGSSFVKEAFFPDTRFNGAAHFSGISFVDDANFDTAHFSGYTDFRKTSFGGEASFSQARFSNNVRFTGASFNGPVNFDQATITDDRTFAGVLVPMRDVRQTWPSGWHLVPADGGGFTLAVNASSPHTDIPGSE
jgi:uncharacterized protein YjbI with pentapeptide repeats